MPLGPKQSRFHLSRAERDRPREGVAHFHSGIDAEGVKQTRRQVLRRDRVVGRVRGEAVRPADDPASGLRASRDEQRIALRPVIAAGFVDAVAGELAEARRAAELAHAHHQRLVEQAALSRVCLFRVGVAFIRPFAHAGKYLFERPFRNDAAVSENISLLYLHYPKANSGALLNEFGNGVASGTRIPRQLDSIFRL